MTALAEPTLLDRADRTWTDGAWADGAWTPVCRTADLVPERGAAALVSGVQVALFRLADGAVVATANRDPATGANVMSRGIIGSRGSAPTVASPLHKQVFDLRDGRCLDGGDLRLATYPVRVADGLVEVAVPAHVQAPPGAEPAVA